MFLLLYLEKNFDEIKTVLVKICKNINDFLSLMPVSQKTAQNLTLYFNLLNKWNQKINLISKTTINNIWNRHFLDSAQIINFFPEKTSKIVDLGTGAGFPGILLAIIKNDFKLNFKTYLIESDLKKCAFLQEVVRICNIENVEIINKRIETIKNINVDIVISRALADLNSLLNYSINFINKNNICIFLKTINIDNEIIQAKKNWGFNYDIKPSISDENGLILILKDIKQNIII